MTRKLKPSVSAVFRFPNGDLLIQDHVKLGKLNIPSGGIEEGEMPAAALQREMYEELGVDISGMDIASMTVHEDVRLATTDGNIEHRFEFNVPDSFKWSNMEPEKHTWIRRIHPSNIHRLGKDYSCILDSVLIMEVVDAHAQ